MGKEGLEFFPFVCTNDDKLDLIEAEFGLKGLAIVVKLFQRIYGERGYYCEWNTEVELLFSKRQCGLMEGDHSVSEVVKAAIKRDLFDKEKYETYSILTSRGIQKRFFEAARRRSIVEVEKQYLLLKVAQIPSNVHINEENVYANSKNVDRNEQSKGKESKGKESKGNKSKEKDFCTEPEQAASMPEPIIALPLNDKTLHPVFQKDIDELKELYPAIDVIQELRNMKGWLLANPERTKTKRGIRRFINSWLMREQDRGKSVTKSAEITHHPASRGLSEQELKKRREWLKG